VENGLRPLSVYRILPEGWLPPPGPKSRKRRATGAPSAPRAAFRLGRAQEAPQAGHRLIRLAPSFRLGSFRKIRFADSRGCDPTLYCRAEQRNRERGCPDVFQKIISGRDLVRRRNPKLPVARQAKEQRATRCFARCFPLFLPEYENAR